MNARRYLLVLCLLTSSCATIPVRTNGRIRAPVRRSAASIEAFLAEKTPLASSSSSVAAFINEQLRHDGGSAPIFGWHDDTCRKGKNCPYFGKGVGHTAQATVLATGQPAHTNWAPDAYYTTMPDLKPILAKPWKGDTATIRVVLGKYMGIPFQIWVMGEWTFDRQDKLIRISVEKQADAL